MIERARVALMERLDGQQAFIDLRRAARSSRREPPDENGGKVVRLPRPHGGLSRPGRRTAGCRSRTWGPWTATSLPPRTGTGRPWDRAQVEPAAARLSRHRGGPADRTAGRARHRPHTAVRHRQRHLAAVRRHPGTPRRMGLIASTRRQRSLAGSASGAGRAERPVLRISPMPSAGQRAVPGWPITSLMSDLSVHQRVGRVRGLPRPLGQGVCLPERRTGPLLRWTQSRRADLAESRRGQGACCLAAHPGSNLGE
jgi:hypothetical protein